MSTEPAPPQPNRARPRDPQLPTFPPEAHGAMDWMFGSAGHTDAHGDRADLVGYWHILRKHKWLILGVLVSIVAATVVLTLLITPLYRATTMLQIDREAVKVVEFDAAAPLERGNSDDFYQTQYELLRSRTLAQRVVRKLDLVREPVMRAMLERSDAAGHAAMLGAGTEQASRQRAAERAAAAVVMAGLQIEPVRNSRLVRVHFDSPDAAFSARVANAVAQGFIESTLERRFDAASYATKFLEERLRQLKVRLEESERDLVQYAQQEQIVSGDQGQSLTGETLSELTIALAAAQNQRIRAEARLRQAQAQAGAGLPPDMLEKSIVRTLQARRADLMAQYQDKLRIYKPDYPDMRQLQGQIDETNRQIAAELGNIRASVRAEYDAARGQENLLGAQIGLARADALDLEKRSIRYNILKREVDTNRQLYDGLLQRYKEVGVAGGVSTNNVSVVDAAQVPGRPFKPSLSHNLLLALLFGLVAGIALAFLLEYLDDRVRGPDDVERMFGLAVLGIVPKLKQQLPLEAARDPRSGFSEAYRSVRTALQFSTDAGVPRTLLITSSEAEEGKTTTAIMLARNFAQLGKRVLLIDADLRSPGLHGMLAARADLPGLSNHLAGATGRAEAIHALDMADLWLMPAGPLPPNPAELLSSPKMDALLQAVAGEYDQVIIDGPPIMGLADAPLLAHLADGTVLMVAAGKSRRGAIRHALKRLGGAQAHILGAIVTFYDPRTAIGSYGYGDYAYGYAADARAARRD